MSDTADLLRAIAGIGWLLLGFVGLAAFLKLLRSQTAPLTKFGIGPHGVTMEWAEARLTEAARGPGTDEATREAVGDAARRSVIDRMRAHAGLLAKARVLWVDDHPENNASLVELLRGFGASVDTPRTNAQALALLSASRYDVIVSDVGRDDEGPNSGLKGIELATEVFERSGQRVVLFVGNFDPANLPDVSDTERLRVVREVERAVFARTNRYDEVLHYILDQLER